MVTTAPSTQPQQDPQTEIRRIANEAREALNSGVEISNEAIQRNISAIKNLYSQNPVFKDSFDNILGSYSSPKMKKFISDNFENETRKGENENNKLLSISERKMAQWRTMASMQPQKFLNSASKFAKYDIPEKDLNDLDKIVHGFKEAVATARAYALIVREYASGKLGSKVKSKIDEALNDPQKINAVIERAKAQGITLTPADVKKQLTQLKSLNLKKNLSTKEGQQGLEKGLAGLMGAGEHAEVADVDLHKHVDQMLVSNIKIVVDKNAKNEAVTGKIRNLIDANIVKGKINPAGSAKIKGTLINNFNQLFDQELGKAPAKLEDSKTGNTAKDTMAAANNIQKLLSSFRGNKNSALRQLADVFDLGPKLTELGKNATKADFMNIVNTRVEKYVNAQVEKINSKLNNKETVDAFNKARKDNPELKFTDFVSELKVKERQKNIDKNMKTIPEYQLGTTEASQYAKALATGEIDMSFQEFVDQRLLPKMHPLMKIFYMLRTVLASFGITLGKKDKRTAKEKMEDLKSGSGITELQYNLAGKQEKQEGLKKLDRFLKNKAWNGTKIKLGEKFMEVGADGKEVKENENNTDREKYFLKEDGSADTEKMDRFTKLFESTNAAIKPLLTKGLKLETLEKLNNLGDKLKIDGNKITIDGQEIKLDSTNLEEDIFKALERSSDISSSEKVFEKAGMKDDFKTAGDDLKALIGQEKFTGSREEAKKLIQKASIMVKFKDKLDSTVQVSDINNKLLKPSGTGFLEKVEAILKLNAEPKLRKEDFDIILDKLEAVNKLENLTGKKANDVILELNNGKDIDYSKTEAEKSAEAAKVAARKKARKSKPKPGEKPTDKPTETTKPLTEEVKNKITKSLKPFKAKLNINPEDYAKIPKNLINEKGELKPAFESLLKLDDKFWGGVKLTTENLKAIGKIINNENISFEDIGMEFGEIFSGNNIFESYFQMKGKDEKFKNITEFLDSLK